MLIISARTQKKHSGEQDYRRCNHIVSVQQYSVGVCHSVIVFMAFNMFVALSLTLGRHVQHAERGRATDDFLSND